MALIVGLLPRRDLARHLQIAGSSLGLVVGLAGFVVGFLANVNPANADPEYGPMTVALLFASHGLASLIAFTPRGPLEPQSR